MSVIRSGCRVRMKVSLPPGVSDRQRRELGAFACYCAQRIERDLGPLGQWKVSVAMGARGGLACMVAVTGTEVTEEAGGEGRDLVLAVWEAMCRLEQRARDQRTAAVVVEAPAA